MQPNKDIPSTLNLTIVKSKYINWSAIINICSLIVFFLLQFLYKGRFSSVAEEIGIPDSVTKYLLILFLFSLTGPFIAYHLEKKYKVIGSITLSCLENEMTYSVNGKVQYFKMDKVSRIILDVSSAKGEMSFGSIYSSGTKNYLTLVLEQNKESFEVLLNSKEEIDHLKMIIFYHTVNFR